MSGSHTRLCLLGFIVKLSDASLQSSQIVNENAALRPIERKALLADGWKIVRIRGSHHVLQKEGKTNDASAFTSLVSCTLSGDSESKSVKKTLTIPAWLNDLASMKGINFSKTLQEALIQKVQS